MTREDAVALVLDVFADRPSGPAGEDVLAALEASAGPMLAESWDAGYLACADDAFRDSELRKRGGSLPMENATPNPHRVANRG